MLVSYFLILKYILHIKCVKHKHPYTRYSELSVYPQLCHSHGSCLSCICCYPVSCFGEGKGTPPQYSCLENPMDGGAWKAAVHGVAEGLSDFTFTFHFHALEKEMATHSSVLAWRIPGTGEPGGLPSMGSHRVGHDWSDLAAAAISCFSLALPPVMFSSPLLY